jgi:hypothetical protein
VYIDTILKVRLASVLAAGLGTMAVAPETHTLSDARVCGHHRTRTSINTFSKSSPTPLTSKLRACSTCDDESTLRVRSTRVP